MTIQKMAQSPELRPFQKETLSILNDPKLKTKHVICVSPTGSGKSLIYERIAAQPGHRTLLITPLIALARQQFEQLKKLKIPVFLGAGGSSQKPPLTETGSWIISPEMLQFESHRSFLKKWNPNFLVIDECHCLWEWGEIFRPCFLLIPPLLKEYSIHKSLWLTATLPYEARVELRNLLPHAPIEIGHFDLPAQIRLFVIRISLSNRASVLLSWIQRLQGKGIVFVSSRQATLRVSRLIESIGKKAIPYHGGMSSEERSTIESMVRSGIPDWIVSTSAFGMGMNYPQLSHVILWHLPPSILALIQIIGRVGRNVNQQGNAFVFWDEDDFQLIEWIVQNSEKKRTRLIELKAFLFSNACRLSILKRYFDHSCKEIQCGRCDICLSLI